MMDEYDWSKFIPVRLPVEWEYFGEAGVHPEIEGITGRRVVLIIEKNFKRFEAFLAKILRAPPTVRRTMHPTQSMIWELIDGERNFSEICDIMESLYHEEIAPAESRVRANLELFQGLNVVAIYKPKEEE